MKNKDRDDRHARRRGDTDPEDEVDGRQVAEALYGGLTDPNTETEDDER